MANSIIGNVIESVLSMTSHLSLYAGVKNGPLPPDNGLSLTVSGGGPASTFLTKGMAYELDLVLNGKHADQMTVFDTLNNIHQALTQTKTYPVTNEFQITNIETTTSPSYLGQEENKQYLYGSSLRVRFFYFKEG